MSSSDDVSTVPTVLVVVGNPKPLSKTRGVGEAVADTIVSLLAEAGVDAAVETLEVTELGSDLLGWGSPKVAAAVEAMVDASVLVVASPVYKATYTGLLKLLLDQVSAGQLAGTPTVPVMVGGSPQHAMAVDSHLRPLLVELGASCPTAGLYVLESTLDSFTDQLGAWASVWSRAITGPISAPVPVPTA